MRADRPIRIAFALIAIALSSAPVEAQDAAVAIGTIAGDPQGAFRRMLQADLGNGGLRIVTERSTEPHATVSGRATVRTFQLEFVGADGATESVRIEAPSRRALARASAARIGELVRAHPLPPPRREEPLPPPPPPPATAPTAAVTTPPAGGTTRGRGARTSASVDELATAHTALAFEAVAGGLSRRMTFRDDLFGTVSGYSLPMGPTFGGAFEWLPALHFTTLRPTTGFGIAASWNALVGVDSSSADGTASYPTRSRSFAVEALYRYPLRASEFTGSIGYGAESFVVDAEGPASPQGSVAPAIPSVDYRFVRLGGDAKVHVTHGFYVGGGAGLRILTDTGELEGFFPGERGFGFDLEAKLVQHLGPAVFLQLSFEYHRYAFSLNPSIGDHYVVGGMGDNWMRLWLGVGVRLPEAR